jgi:hypothetical protein
VEKFTTATVSGLKAQQIDSELSYNLRGLGIIGTQKSRCLSFEADAPLPYLNPTRLSDKHLGSTGSHSHALVLRTVGAAREQSFQVCDSWAPETSPSQDHLQHCPLWSFK